MEFVGRVEAQNWWEVLEPGCETEPIQLQGLTQQELFSPCVNILSLCQST